MFRDCIRIRLQERCPCGSLTLRLFNASVQSRPRWPNPLSLVTACMRYSYTLAQNTRQYESLSPLLSTVPIPNLKQIWPTIVHNPKNTAGYAASSTRTLLTSQKIQSHRNSTASSNTHEPSKPHPNHQPQKNSFPRLLHTNSLVLRNHNILYLCRKNRRRYFIDVRITAKYKVYLLRHGWMTAESCSDFQLMRALSRSDRRMHFCPELQEKFLSSSTGAEAGILHVGRCKLDENW